MHDLAESIVLPVNREIVCLLKRPRGLAARPDRRLQFDLRGTSAVLGRVKCALESAERRGLDAGDAN